MSEDFTSSMNTAGVNVICKADMAKVQKKKITRIFNPVCTIVASIKSLLSPLSYVPSTIEQYKSVTIFTKFEICDT